MILKEFELTSLSILKMLNFKEETTSRVILENFVCMRLLQNFNRKKIDLDKCLSSCLTQIFGTNAFEGLRSIGLALETSSSKLKGEYIKLFSKVKTDKPEMGFDFILTDEPKRLSVEELSLVHNDSMTFYENLFYDFYHQYFNNSYKKCTFSMSLGTVELALKGKGKVLNLCVFPFDALILSNVGKRKLEVADLFARLSNLGKEKDKKLFLKAISNLADHNLLLVFNGEFSDRKDVNFKSLISVNRNFVDQFPNNKSRFINFELELSFLS